MSGHSKWSTIKRQKEANDAKRGQLFSKLARALSLAVRAGGPNPEVNIRLRTLIEKAKKANMPKANIERAMQEGAKGETLEEVVYEGYGPEGVPIIIEAATNNKNRTAQEIKNIFSRGGGSLGSPGSVAFQFKKAGQILVEPGENPEKTMLALIDLGVEDVDEVGDGIEVYTKPEELYSIKEKIEANIAKVLDTELVYRPVNPVVLTDQQVVQRVMRLLEELDNHPDVQKVYAGFDY